MTIIKWALLMAMTGLAIQLHAQNKSTLSGYVKESGSGELLLGVTIYIPELKTGTATNSYGFYSITLPTAEYEIHISYIGYKTLVKTIDLSTDLEFEFNLEPESITLEGVTVVAEKQERISETAQMSLVKIPAAQIQDMPTLLGEKDVLKTLQLMPGVQSGSEGSSGIYVRGGGPDQNLLILDDAVVYNANHLFGFFSVFNGDAIKNIELYKGGFPARYGGRLSSVVDMNMKDGNKEEVHGKVGIGIISSNATIEGPLKKGTSSFLVSARRTYADVLIRPFQKKNKGGYYFYDFNTKLNYDFGKKNKLYLSGYFGRDRFFLRTKDDGIDEDAGLNWGNQTATLRWNHLFNNKLFANTSLIFSDYRFVIGVENKSDGEVFKLDYKSGIRDYTGKFDIDFLPNPAHAVKAGVLMTYHTFTPSAVQLKDTQAENNTNKRQEIETIESAIYAEDDIKINDRIMVNTGIRLSLFKFKDHQYVRPEPRLSMGYKLKEDLSIKASYAIMNQYIHLLSNSGIGLPTDLWVPSTKKVKPQRSQQVALGLAKDLVSQNLTVTLEGYYKESTDVIAYKEGADFLVLNDLESSDELQFENNITSGNGTAYGVELMLQRKFGKFRGWLGYTLSWTKLQFDSLNFGKEFYAKYDRRHDVSIVGTYKPHERITLSAAFVYGTGNALTLPVVNYSALDHRISDIIQVADEDRVIDGYRERGNFRAEAYHRMDVGIQFHKQRPKSKRTIEVGVYNAYNRKNPFYYSTSRSVNPDTGEITKKLKRTTIFPLIPSITYKLEF